MEKRIASWSYWLGIACLLITIMEVPAQAMASRLHRIDYPTPAIPLWEYDFSLSE